ncbi:MAG: SDR family oxidoreductase [Deltaproteobacteria bacterium]|jgi:NAD(P)-dependent dehydrogenase (short-subunit alcohol dehydrogenase family)|nr:SDR family oxidoreductase [Deltaproteobacteria bacterium]MBT4087779.1 SDR family oxidoreductase [Deltaproteobacteria bacterium]MBT4265872.1 SDR family oxidoreductase [Deltaproteobacteria bacterium]MBT4643706.1 SDR family oxidoreductase [Deltaproteobacteria bacterium]MBT6502843.1 SDR family oxidoreductase [Deltaproteobacteria bacterium]
MGDVSFEGRVAIVTGAGAGLGRTYALELARRGAKVVVNDLGGSRDGSGASSSAADQVVDEIKQAGGEAAPNYDSVASVEGGVNIVKTAVDNFGKVDIVINNAGILRDKSIVKMEESEWDLVMDVHLKGAFCVTQPAFKVMKANGYGRVVNTASGAGLYGNFGQINYSSAKLGVLGVMHSVHIEGAKYNIKANTIAPIAASRLTEDVMPPEIFTKLDPKFVTPLVMYLVSEENQDSDMIFNCAAGWFSRTAIMCAPGTIIGNGVDDISTEQVRDEWSKITSLDEAKVLAGGVNDSFGYLAPLMTGGLSTGPK